jgi:hypothetical protein
LWLQLQAPTTTAAPTARTTTATAAAAATGTTASQLLDVGLNSPLRYQQRQQHQQQQQLLLQQEQQQLQSTHALRLQTPTTTAPTTLPQTFRCRSQLTRFGMLNS